MPDIEWEKALVSPRHDLGDNWFLGKHPLVGFQTVWERFAPARPHFDLSARFRARLCACVAASARGWARVQAATLALPVYYFMTEGHVLRERVAATSRARHRQEAPTKLHQRGSQTSDVLVTSNPTSSSPSLIYRRAIIRRAEHMKG